MTFERLSEKDKRIVRECMNAIVDGPFLDDFEFETRIGVDREEMRRILRTYPDLEDDNDESPTAICINNSLNEVSYGLPFSDDEWSAWFTVTRSEIQEVYKAWARQRGWTSTGPR